MAKMMFVLAAIMMVMSGVFAEDHTVGDDEGWTRPPSPGFYSSWAARQTFAVGDTLEFNFATGAHTVAMVPKAAYDSCTAGNAEVHTDGPTEIRLNEAGSFFFICTIAGHCDGGQKLAINVTSAASTTPSPPSGSPPSPPSGDTGSASSPHMPLTSTLFSLSFFAFVVALLY